MLKSRIDSAGSVNRERISSAVATGLAGLSVIIQTIASGDMPVRPISKSHLVMSVICVVLAVLCTLFLWKNSRKIEKIIRLAAIVTAIGFSAAHIPAIAEHSTSTSHSTVHLLILLVLIQHIGSVVGMLTGLTVTFALLRRWTDH